MNKDAYPLYTDVTPRKTNVVTEDWGVVAITEQKVRAYLVDGFILFRVAFLGGTKGLRYGNSPHTHSTLRTTK